MPYCALRVFAVRTVAVATLLATFGIRSAQAQTFRPVEDGPIHEAFVPAVTGISALEAIGKEPPPPIIEKPPASCHPEAIWIKGYWAYDEDSDDFQWVGGCWRRPPRGQHWVEGFWHPVDDGWVWIRGFWSPVAAPDLVFIDDAPPEPIDEDAPNSPSASYFWLTGYWGYEPSRGYVRYAGRWMEMDPRFILVPASYTWRPEGYVFLAAYWDWPIEERGCTYQTVYVEPAARVAEVIYEPVVVVEPAVVVGWCYSYYPNYVYLVHHHYHHHHDWWYAHYDVPTWWGWHNWWSLSWHDHWGVWWWWSHPGYPHPHFMNAAYAARIAPPVHKNVFKVKNVYAPKIVTVNGVVSPKETLKDAKKHKSKGTITPVVAAKTKDKLADEKKGSKKDDDEKGNKKDQKIAKADTLVPTGTKSAKDEEADPKKQPGKPTKKQQKVVSTPTTTPAPGTIGSAKGKDKDDDKTKGKSGPPITVKGKTDEGDSKVKGKTGKSDKPVGKSSPPIVPKVKMKDKDDDKPKAKDGDKPKGKDSNKPTGKVGQDAKPARPPIVPSGSDKSKDKDKDRDGDKSKDKSVSSGKKSGSGDGGSPPLGEAKSKDRDKPPTRPSGGGKDDKPDKNKDKDKDKDKKKENRNE